MTIINDFVQSLQSSDGSETDYKKVWEMLGVAKSEPGEMAKLLTAILRADPEFAEPVHAGADYLDDEGFEHLFLTALKMAALDGITETIHGVFDVTCLYAPHIVQAHFAAFFDLAADDALSEGISPCRIDDDDVVAFLQEKLLDEATPKPVRQRAWACLIATERVDAFSTAVRHLEGLAPAEGWWAMETRQHAGWIKMGERTDRLFQSQGYHMIFPDGFIDPEERKTEHTTWRCATENPVTAQFGGSAQTACGSCGRTLHGLLKLDAKVCAHLSVGLPGLALVCCLSCLYWEQGGLFFEHDEHGHPSPLLATEEKATPQFLREPYQSTKVQLVPTPRRWARQHWALADEKQNLNRVGGAPTWVQDPCFPDCTKCGESMPFVAQLDTGLPMIDGKAHYWGSGGIGYIHWCEQCRISAVHLQCT